MKLAKLEMVGFKSFAEKTEFAFEPGVTALVGPNGCGKSNVVDAVRWILGEQRARAVRGGEMADVIFCGTEKRRSMGYAEASLTILNADRKLPIDYEEVCITRRIYRTGESEYLINGQPCRLRDVRALFTDTGVGMDTYSIIEQGKVDRLLQANATERRAVFEEAAGISGYKEQRRHAEARLERTMQNLLRVNDIIQEKEKRLRSVKYQAAKARRHTEYMDRLKELAVALARRNYDELETRVKAAQEQLSALESRRNTLTAEVECIEKEVAQLRELARRQQEAHTAKEQQIHLVDSQVSTCEERVRSGKLRAQELDEAADAASRNVGGITEKISRAQTDLKSAEEELGVVEEGVRSQTQEVEQRSAAASAALRQAAELEQRLEDCKAKVWDCLQHSAQVRNQIAQLTSKSQQDEARISRLTSRYAEAQKELSSLEEQRQKLLVEIAEAKGRMDEQSKAIAACHDEARQLNDDLARLSAEANQLRTACAELRSRRNMLHEMETNASGVQQGVKRLLGRLDGAEAPMAGLPAVAGVRGMVAELIEVDLPHAVAIEAALGERAQSVVCDDTPSALTALKTLADEKAGRASLLPLDRVRALRPEARARSAEAGVLGAAVDLVRHGHEIAPIVRALLGDVLIVRSMSDAVRLSQNGGRELRLVTLEGEIVEPGGALSGGDRTAAGGVISRRSELKDVERRLAEATAEADKLDNQREDLMQRLNAAEERRRSCERELAAQRERQRDLESRQEIISSQEKRLRDELTVVKSETRELEENLRSDAEQENRLKEQLLHLTRAQAELDAEIDTAKTELRARREHANQLAQDVTGLRVELAHKTEKRDSLKQRIDQLCKGITENTAELETARGQIETYRKRRIEADEQVAESRQKILELRVSRDQFEKELIEAKQRCDETQTAVGRTDERTHGLRRQLADLQQRHENLRIQEHEDRVRMADLADRVRDEYETSLAELPAQVGERNWEEVQKEVADLQQKLRAMGPVNLEAISEQDELEESIRFNTEQRDDLVSAQKSLDELITRLNKISRERFMQTFEEIRVNFREIFRKVFGGGKADIFLEAPAPPPQQAAPVVDGATPQAAEAANVAPPPVPEIDVLEAGIEIVASPPGKELRSIRQLSGGEKTMTTIALLFAIFKTKPSPFCILDEVDAALDESNIDRFANIVREFLMDSQFIIITHSKRTLGIADVLYGITMEEEGVSKKVSVRLNQAVEMVA